MGSGPTGTQRVGRAGVRHPAGSSQREGEVRPQRKRPPKKARFDAGKKRKPHKTTEKKKNKSRHLLLGDSQSQRGTLLRLEKGSLEQHTEWEKEKIP